jgi:uncharacterized protein (TIGR03435 family)
MRLAILLLACSAGLAADGPQFEVASVKPSIPSPDGRIRIMNRGGPGTSDPGQITYMSITLKNLLTTAYGVKGYQILGPGWLDTKRYDVTAKIPPDTSKEQFALMLQNLLAERFKLTLHHETKDLPLYELQVAKNGPKMKPYVADPNAPPPPAPGEAPGPPPMGKDGRPIVRPGGTMIMIMNGRLQLTSSKQSMAGLANLLANQLSRPVVDKTGLTGEYDYTLEFSQEGLSSGPFGATLPPPPPGAGAPAGPTTDLESPSLLAAVQEQLGLRLDSKKGPLDLLVIDRADKTPVEN